MRWTKLTRLDFVIAPIVGAGIVVVAAAIYSVSGREFGTGEIIGALALFAAATIAEAFPVPIESVSAGNTSLATVFIVASAVIFGWTVAAISGAAAMFIVETMRREEHNIRRTLVNTGIYAISALAAGVFVGGKIWMALPAGIIFWLVNITLLAAVIAAFKSEKTTRLWSTYAQQTLTPAFVMAAMSAVIVALGEGPKSFWAFMLAPPIVSIAWYQRRLQGSLEHQRDLDRMKDEFIATVSHELRTPLATVYGGAMTLARRDLKEEQRELLLDAMKREGERLNHLVEDVIWVSRIALGKKLFASANVIDIRETVKYVAEGFRLAQRMPILLHMPDHLPGVKGDEERMRRVFGNLIENAIKYQPTTGEIDISAKKVGKSVAISVADHGNGIPEAKKQEIFDRFTRLDPMQNNGVSGTGLGLYITKEILHDLGATIVVTDNPGGGSIFTVTMPI